MAKSEIGRLLTRPPVDTAAVRAALVEFHVMPEAEARRVLADTRKRVMVYQARSGKRGVLADYQNSTLNMMKSALALDPRVRVVLATRLRALVTS